MTRRLAQQGGMTLIEVMVTVLVVCVGTLATLGTYAHFSSATDTARERSVLSSVAQRELEQLRPITYAQLGLAKTMPAQASSDAPLSGPAASETLVNGGIVNPGGPGDGDFTYQGVRGRIYRYVTNYNESCGTLNLKVQSQLASLFSQTLVNVQAALPQLCLALPATKRLTIVVVPLEHGTSAANAGVRMSTIVADTSSALPVVDNVAHLAVKSVTVQASQSTAATTSDQTLTLTDTRCTSPVRLQPSSHSTSDTSQAGFTCAASGPAPTLLSLSPLGGAASDPVADFSTDVTRAAQGGLAMLRDTQAGSCTDPSNLVYTNAQTDQRKHAIHTWATTIPALPYETPLGGGRGSLTLWSSTADGNPHPGRMCVTLRRASTGQVIGVSDFKLASWPAQPTELTTAFDLDHVALPAGERLLLTIRVPADSGSDIRILYDHAKYSSTLSLSTIVGKEFK